MTIAFFEVEPWEEELLKQLTKQLKTKVIVTRDKLEEKNVDKYKDASIISPFIYSKINKKILAKLPKLKFIATRSTGYDHIDLTECKKRKVIVSNVPKYGEHTVAEHTFGLILTLTRKLHEAFERTKKRDFSLNGLRGIELYKKTIGIVGFGKIGQCVAKIAKGFEMKVLAYDKIQQSNDVTFVPLETLLKQSDVITLHTPYAKETHHLINKKNLALIKKGALIINTARGGLIETEALLEGLNNHLIAGAGLDVLEEEPLIKEENELLSKHFDNKTLSLILKNHILIGRNDVVITPHHAFYSDESLERIATTTLSNIKAFLENKPENLVQ